MSEKNDYYNPSLTIPLVAIEDGITIIVVTTSKDVRVTVYRKGQDSGASFFSSYKTHKNAARALGLLALATLSWRNGKQRE